MPAVDPKELHARFEELKQERTSWEGLWKDIRDYEAPDLGAFEGDNATEGSKRYGPSSTPKQSSVRTTSPRASSRASLRRPVRGFGSPRWTPSLTSDPT